MPFKHRFRIHWVDTDVAGVMHFTNFLRYFEACEEEFYRSISLPFNTIREKYGKLAAEGSIKCIAVNSQWKAVSLPPELAKSLSENGT